MYDLIVVGAGFAGAVIAEQAANDGKRVLLLEKRDHIGGNSYDYHNDLGILVHKYGPHLFHTNSERVANYIRNYVDVFPYEHQVVGYVDGSLVPIPFNMNSIRELFPSEKAEQVISTLVHEYGRDVKVPILKLRESESPEINALADFVYEKVFKYYTMKQWGVLPEEIDPSVTKRVPVSISVDNRYFQDEYQFMPVGGFTKLFDAMLSHDKIEVRLGVDAAEYISLQDGNLFFEKKPYKGQLIYTGPVDELFQFRFGELPYRSLEFVWENHDVDSYQSHTVVNYPTPENEHQYTRITEFKKCSMETPPNACTTVIKEFPCAYKKGAERGGIPYYPILNEQNGALLQQYIRESELYPNVHLLGRLAEYKYYNMDMIILRALKYYEGTLRDL